VEILFPWPSPYHVYPEPPPPPSQPPTISDVIVALLFWSIIVGYTVSDDVEIKSVYAEVLNSDTYQQVQLKNADDVPDSAVSHSAAFNFLDLASGRSYIVKMYAVDTNDNITIREEYTEVVDMAAPTINLFTTKSHVPGYITVDVNLTADSGGWVFAFVSLYWLFDLDNELDYYYIELINVVGSVTFRDLDPERTYVVDLFIRNNSYNSRIVRIEGDPNGMGVVVSE